MPTPFTLQLPRAETRPTRKRPQIVSPKADDIISVLEGLGFERSHGIAGENAGSDFATTRMKNEGGFHVDIAKSAAVPQDMCAIRMNVDDYDKACSILEAHGFVNANGGRVTDLGSSKSVFMRAPSGFCISVVKHIKKGE